MVNEFTLDVRDAGELADAFERNGYTNADIKKMSERRVNLLRELLQVIRGEAEVVVVQHTIDLDADPFIPHGWAIEEHRKMGQFNWDPAKVGLYVSEQQKKPGGTNGHKLRRKVADQDPFNANLLDYLRAHPRIIPEEWKEKPILFWATIYRDSDDRLYVRSLYWGVIEWMSSCHMIDIDFGPDALAAVRSAR